jgi:hypothetical protein
MGHTKKEHLLALLIAFVIYCFLFFAGRDDASVLPFVQLRQRLGSGPCVVRTQNRFPESEKKFDRKDRLENGNFCRGRQSVVEPMRGLPPGAQNRQRKTNFALPAQPPCKMF